MQSSDFLEIFLLPIFISRRPIPTKVSCGHFWHHLLVAKGGKTTSLRRICRPEACTTALRKAWKKWRRRCERPERVCDKRSLSCPLSERRRRHPQLFAVLDLLVLLGQAKSSKKNGCRFLSARGCGAQRRAGRSLCPRRPAKKARTPQTSPRKLLAKIFPCPFCVRKSRGIRQACGPLKINSSN